MIQKIWSSCLDHLKNEIPPERFNLLINPLQIEQDGCVLVLLAPNPIIQEQVRDNYGRHILEIIKRSSSEITDIRISVGSRKKSQEPSASYSFTVNGAESVPQHIPANNRMNYKSSLKHDYTFEHFVEGKSNQLARAASLQVSQNPGVAYNPLFIYGGVGLGKTHLMQAIGHRIKADNPAARVVYLHSERFVADMVRALQHNAMNDFKGFYRSLDALLIDDIQFFAGKERSQEEFFHTFNSLLEGQKQIILTCDTFPKGVQNIEERLRSRLGWGLTVSVDPPELETRVAILHSKAQKTGITIPDEVAFFIAQNVRSNIRELEGALSRVHANAQFRGEQITLAYAKEALRDQLSIQAQQITIDNIQKIVAEYFKIRVADILSKKRNRSVVRPRQIAMALAKELTNHSLPEIGDAFGGKDHTTVMHSCKKVIELRDSEPLINEDYKNLLRTITT